MRTITEDGRTVHVITEAFNVGIMKVIQLANELGFETAEALDELPDGRLVLRIIEPMEKADA